MTPVAVSRRAMLLISDRWRFGRFGKMEWNAGSRRWMSKNLLWWLVDVDDGEGMDD